MIVLKTYLLLIYEFFKTGLFAVGGGLATIPFLRDIATEHPGWFSVDRLSDMIAISESTPGPVGVNMATYAGFVASSSFGLPLGIVGAIITTFALVAPSVIVIYFVSKAYRRFKENPLVTNAFYAVRPAVAGMIAAVGLTLVESGLLVPGYVLKEFYNYINIKALILFVIFIVAMNVGPLEKLHPIFFIIAAGVCGAVFAM